MSKDNMEELRRHRIRQPGQVIDPCPEGEWVRFSDVQEREARLQARIEELEAQVQDLTESAAPREEQLYGQVKDLEAHAARLTAGIQGIEWVTDARWRERIEGKAEMFADCLSPISPKWAAAHLRSLLDSGEEQKASEPAIYEGYGRKWERVKGTSALREVGDTGPDWDQCVYHMIGGRVQRFLMAEREARPSPSPALEGREDECSGLCADTGDCSLECGSAEGGFASGVTTNSEPSPGGETDEDADLLPVAARTFLGYIDLEEDDQLILEDALAAAFEWMNPHLPKVHRHWYKGDYWFFLETGERRVPKKGEWALYVGSAFRATGEGEHEYPILTGPIWLAGFRYDGEVVPAEDQTQEAVADPKKESDPVSGPVGEARVEGVLETARLINERAVRLDPDSYKVSDSLIWRLHRELEAGLPVSQGMVRDGEVVVSREDLRTVLGPRASGTSAAIERRLASDRLRSVLAREGGEA